MCRTVNVIAILNVPDFGVAHGNTSFEVSEKDMQLLLREVISVQDRSCLH